jgi:hypothetical protein
MPDERKCYMLTRERFGWPPGTIVYGSLECDYGMANQDTRTMGMKHIYVCVDTRLHPETLRRGLFLKLLIGCRRTSPFPCGI